MSWYKIINRGAGWIGRLKIWSAWLITSLGCHLTAWGTSSFRSLFITWTTCSLSADIISTDNVLVMVFYTLPAKLYRIISFKYLCQPELFMCFFASSVAQFRVFLTIFSWSVSKLMKATYITYRLWIMFKRRASQWMLFYSLLNGWTELLLVLDLRGWALVSCRSLQRPEPVLILIGMELPEIRCSLNLASCK